jgi:hypothetical protein
MDRRGGSFVSGLALSKAPATRNRWGFVEVTLEHA